MPPNSIGYFYCRPAVWCGTVIHWALIIMRRVAGRIIRDILAIFLLGKRNIARRGDSDFFKYGKLHLINLHHA